MASTRLDICNSALIKLGAATVSSLSDNNKQARLVDFQFDLSLNFLLGVYGWSFARKRAILTADPTPPAFDFSNRFELPADFIAVLTIKHPGKFQKEGNYILANVEELYIRYIASGLDPSTFNHEFDEALACHIASQICYALVQNNQLKESLFNEANFMLGLAKKSDSLNSTPIELDANEWLNSRLIGGTQQFSTI